MANLNAALGYQAGTIRADLALEEQRRRREQMYMAAASRAAAELGKAAISSIGPIGSAIAAVMPETQENAAAELSAGQKGADGFRFKADPNATQDEQNTMARAKMDAAEREHYYTRDYVPSYDRDLDGESRSKRHGGDQRDAYGDAQPVRQGAGRELRDQKTRLAAVAADAERAAHKYAAFGDDLPGSTEAINRTADELAQKHNINREQALAVTNETFRNVQKERLARDKAEGTMELERNRQQLVRDAQADRADAGAANAQIELGRLQLEREKLAQRRAEMQARANASKRRGSSRGGGSGRRGGGQTKGKGLLPPPGQRTEKDFTAFYNRWKETYVGEQGKQDPTGRTRAANNYSAAFRYFQNVDVPNSRIINSILSGASDVPASMRETGPDKNPMAARGSTEQRIIDSEFRDEFDMPPGETRTEDLERDIAKMQAEAVGGRASGFTNQKQRTAFELGKTTYGDAGAHSILTAFRILSAGKNDKETAQANVDAIARLKQLTAQSDRTNAPEDIKASIAFANDIVKRAGLDKATRPGSRTRAQSKPPAKARRKQPPGYAQAIAKLDSSQVNALMAKAKERGGSSEDEVTRVFYDLVMATAR